MNDNLGNRIKRYEQAYKYNLTPRSCLFIRVDGKAFHSFTKNLERPFDQDFITAMVYAASQTMQYQMQGCVAAYVQSDECTFMLTDFEAYETQGWFDYELNKVVSISAAAYTAYFNENLAAIGKKGNGTAIFDSRAFIVPKDDAPNAFIWRQRDWQRNSLQMLARTHFSHKELYKKQIQDIHDMLYEKGVNWANLSAQHKNGTYLFGKPQHISHRHMDYDSLYKELFKQEVS